MRRILFYLLTLSILNGFGQNLTKVQLEQLEYEELLEYYDKLNYDSLQGEIVARVYLDRAREEKDTIKMARGYDRLARLFHPKKNIAFADSVIDISKNLNNITFPGAGYILKAHYNYSIDDLASAMENYLLAYDNSLKSGNITQQVFVSDMLIFLKSVWGNKEDALEMQRERHKIVSNPEYVDIVRQATRADSYLKIEDEYTEELILSLENYAYCFLSLRKLDSAKYYIKEARNQLNHYEHVNKPNHESFINELNLELNYFENNFSKVVKVSNQLLYPQDNNYSLESLQNINMLKGLALFKLSNDQEGLRFLEIADSIFETNQRRRIQPQDRLIFSNLHEYFKKSNNLYMQIKYLNKLIYVDSVLKRNYKYFEPDMLKNFETPKMLAEKERLIVSLEEKNSRVNMGLYSFITALLISISLLGYYINRQRTYKKRYETLVADNYLQAKSHSLLPSEDRHERNEISTEVVEEILAHLNKFEMREQFLSSDINLHDLAKTFQTNPNYLSRVINLKMEKNFSQYINDLRIAYIMKALKENSTLRKYSIKAIASECGFKGSDAFTRAFYKLNGIYPSFYLKQLKKEAH